MFLHAQSITRLEEVPKSFLHAQYIARLDDIPKCSYMDIPLLD